MNDQFTEDRNHENLLSAVIKQIEEDINNDTYMALYELLNYIPVRNLLNYLDEEKQSNF